MWLWVSSNPTNSKHYLFDLDQRVIQGEITNGFPVLGNADKTKFLCEGPHSPTSSLRERLTWFVEHHLLRRDQKSDRLESFWVVDVRNKKSRLVGDVSQYTGLGSSWVPSPGYTYGYNEPSKGGYFLWDFTSEKMSKLPLDQADLKGWWSGHEILYLQNKSVWLIDVKTRSSSQLFSRSQVEATLRSHGLKGSTEDLNFLFVHNGEQSEIYVTPSNDLNDWSKPSFLFKLNQVIPEFAVISRNFTQRWGGVFSPGGRYYAYQGESGVAGTGGNGSVHLLDMVTHQESVLVPPDHGGQYSLPRFYKEEIIFFRSRQMYRIRLDGTREERLLAPVLNP